MLWDNPTTEITTEDNKTEEVPEELPLLKVLVVTKPDRSISKS